MKTKRRFHQFAVLAACCFLAGCGKKFNPADGAPPVSQVVEDGNMSLFTVAQPEQFPLVTAQQVNAPAELNVTGTVTPDVSREVPVISLASGRVVDIRVQLDDTVRKGQLLLRVQSPDITNAFDAYLKAKNDEQLAEKAYLRAQDLYNHGAVALSALEQADDTEKDAQADLTAAENQLNVLGVNKNHPSSLVDVAAPISGVIVAQNVTNAAAAGVTYSGSSNLFTIADLSTVWVLCDVYENDIPKVHVGQLARIHVDAYPNLQLTGTVSDIGPVLDPNIRTAKVRIAVHNPGLLRLGMFVTATLTSRSQNHYATVPASAILHLHDRDWVFVPASNSRFQRVEVQAGDMLPGNRQQILAGINAGQSVVSNVLQLEATLEAQ